jgi:sensor histidine kinase YesM
MHIVFWIVVLLYYTLFFGHQQGNYLITFQFVLLLMPITIATTYFFNYYLIPNYLLKNKIRQFVLFGAYTLIASFWITSLIFLPTITLVGSGPGMFDKSLIDLYFVIVGLYSVSILAILIKLLKYWYEQQHASLQLIKEKTETELAMLKGQINPHFLFNTLNNIYALALKKSDLTAESVVKLSEMLDYLLYECNADLVDINKEIKLIQNYIYLQKIRFGRRLDILFDTEGVLEQKIPPMLLLPFIENSFKHGVGKQSKEVWVKMMLHADDQYILFNVMNSKLRQKGYGDSPESGGIGLKNVKKRLKLLFQNNYALDIENLSDTFKVRLQIPTYNTP